MNAAVENAGGYAVEQETSLSDYFAIIGRRKKIFLSVFVVVLVIAIGLAMALPPVYRSTATILIQQPSSLSAQLVGGNSNLPVEQTVEALVRSVLIKPNLLEIINKYDLYSDFRSQVTEQVLAKKMEKGITVHMLNPEVANVGKKGKNNQMAMEVAFEIENDPELAQKVASEVTALFLRENDIKRKQVTGKTTAFLRQEAAKLEKTLAGIEAELTNFKERNLGVLPEQMNMIVSEQERTERELLGVQQQISAIRASTIQLRGQLAGTKSYIYEDRTLIRNTEGEKVLSATGRLQTLQQEYHSLISKYSQNHPKVKKVKREIESLGGNVGAIGSSPLVNDNLEIARVELAEAMQKYSPSHPEVKRLQAKVSRLENQASMVTPQTSAKEFNTLRRINPVFSSLKSGIASGEAELASLNARKAELQAKLDSYAGRMELAPHVEQEYNRIKRKYDDTLKELTDIRKNLNSAERVEALESGDSNERFVLLEPPEVPVAPIKPNRPAIIALGALLGLGLAFAMAMLMESLDESITGPAALVSITGARPLGTIPVILSQSEMTAYVRRKRMNLVLTILGVVLVVVGAVWAFSEGGPLEQFWESFKQLIAKKMF
jgi:uncharacterized protein involved in exopolysaccharide biosynthesis